MKLSRREKKLIEKFEQELAEARRKEKIESPLLKHIRAIEKAHNLDSGGGKVYILVKVGPFDWRPYKHAFRSHLGASMFADVYFSDSKYKTVSEYELGELGKIIEEKHRKREETIRKAKSVAKRFLEGTAREYRNQSKRYSNIRNKAPKVYPVFKNEIKRRKRR